MKIYVDINAPINGDGSQERPFKAIQSAANIAMPGDEVLVAPGTYRENVDPKHAGTADQRIIYRSTEPLGAVITGAERVATWEALAGDVWQVRIPNSIFGNYNPYTTRVLGDWFDARIVAHTGEVYLNDKISRRQSATFTQTRAHHARRQDPCLWAISFFPPPCFMYLIRIQRKSCVILLSWDVSMFRTVQQSRRRQSSSLARSRYGPECHGTQRGDRPGLHISRIVLKASFFRLPLAKRSGISI